MNDIRIRNMNETPVASPAEGPQTPVVQYAGIAERFLALLVDYGIIFIPLELGLSLVLKIISVSPKWNIDTWIVVAVNILFVLYETIFSCGDRMTLGKSLMGIAVVKQDLSGSLSFGQAFRRAIGYYISAFLLGCGFLWAFIDDRHRSLHDFLGGSVVVQIRQKSLFEKIVVRLAGLVLIGAFVYVFYFHLFGGREWQEKYKVKQAEEFLVDIALLENAHKRLYGNYTNDYLRLVLLSGDPVQFQRDMNKVIHNKGFKIGVKGDSYKISARAKDKKKTPVYYTYP